ncbi:hypothetical protein AVMA1855_19985 [Acidovorax sp. SUPP1855]|uniref:hypothetical protein n=1 Tax=Acidovorax sp. SUPP1855 TaxID=431774 RepID=UPI0023DE1F70|nr:hypothetical protein [Acidovorax sp. SUPP1855]GKS86471.1 hypothetical protein AVMA1855_19985 [Acidovorax sp. SUPP1855]
MPVYKLEGPDGRVYSVEGPEGATAEQLGSFITSQMGGSQQAPAQPKPQVGMLEGAGMGLLRGAKDVIDTGALGLASLYDKVTGGDRSMSSLITGQPTGEAARVRAMNDAGKAEFDAKYGDSTAASIGRIGGNVAATLPAGGVLGYGMRAAAPMMGAAAPTVASLGNSIATGGMTTGNLLNPAANMAARIAGGGISGGVSAGLIDPNSAGTGAAIGAALPPTLRVAQAIGSLGKGAAKNLIGRTTGTSPETLSAAFAAGQTGNQTFLQNMRGQAEFSDVVDAARTGLDQMRRERGAQYRNGMTDISADKKVLDFAPIDRALQSVRDMGSYKGVQTNKNAAGVVDELAGKVGEWRGLNPAEYHTPEGLDALKRAIGDIRDATQFGTPARKAADSVYNSVKGEISKQAPTYSKVMGDYAKASDDLSQIERALSLGDKAAKDTSIRKLQSLMRNNAQSNYGNRLSLAQQLEQQGGVELTPAIAGQALNTWTPRGLSGAVQMGGLGLGAYANPAAIMAAPFASPRAMGEAAYGLGLLSNKASGMASRGGGLLGVDPETLLLSRGLLSSIPVAISANQTTRQ